jgi:hypothetical protein
MAPGSLRSSYRVGTFARHGPSWYCRGLGGRPVLWARQGTGRDWALGLRRSPCVGTAWAGAWTLPDSDWWPGRVRGRTRVDRAGALHGLAWGYSRSGGLGPANGPRRAGRDSDLATVTGGPGGRGVTAVCCSGLILGRAAGPRVCDLGSDGREVVSGDHFAMLGLRGRARRFVHM